MDPRKGEQMTTSDQMFSANITHYSDVMFAGIIKATQPEVFRKLRKLPNWLDTDGYLLQFQEVMRRNQEAHAMIVLCSYIDRLLETEVNGSTAVNRYYLLPQKIAVFPEYILTARRSPFVDRLNEYSMHIFESGMIQHFPILLGKIDGLQHKNDEIEAQVLTIKEMLEAIRIWYQGIFISSIIFIIEVLWICMVRNAHKILNRIQMSIGIDHRVE
jgi:hypothetical protein